MGLDESFFLTKLQGNIHWEMFDLCERLHRFMSEEVPSLFDTSDRKQRNKLEDDLNKLSLRAEPRQSRHTVPQSGDSAA